MTFKIKGKTAGTSAIINLHGDTYSLIGDGDVFDRRTLGLKSEYTKEEVWVFADEVEIDPASSGRAMMTKSLVLSKETIRFLGRQTSLTITHGWACYTHYGNCNKDLRDVRWFLQLFYRSSMK